MAVRSQTLQRALRCFCLGAFNLLGREQVDLPYAFEEHAAPGRPSLYEYRPLVRNFVEARAERLAASDDARIAIDELRREPAAAIFARAHAGVKPTEEEALLRTVLLPLLVKTAEACGGFDWDDGAFDHAYVDFERSLFGERRSYAAVAPVVGISSPVQLELGRGIRLRPAATGELATLWPEARGLLPADFGREPDRLCVLELEQALPPRAVGPPDAPGELADVVTALRLATAAPVSAGPVLFERLDWRPLGVRPVLPIAAAQPGGEPTRLDAFRARLTSELLSRLVAADSDPDLGEALDRWELSLFQGEPFRSEQLRESLSALLGGTDGLWASALRASLLLGESPRERAGLMAGLSRLAGGGRATGEDADLLRRALVEVLMHGDRARLVEALDESALGLRPRPAGYFAARAVAS
ncbi:MAG: hypothetical protein H0W87_03465 [Actinobacteria bacterium]|nr:hypothetical protein [Actinomycetota bacterium]